MCRHFHLQPIRYLVRIKADGGSYAEERDVIIFHFLCRDVAHRAADLSEELRSCLGVGGGG
jgi:hypothetical protein